MLVYYIQVTDKKKARPPPFRLCIYVILYVHVFCCVVHTRARKHNVESSTGKQQRQNFDENNKNSTSTKRASLVKLA